MDISVSTMEGSVAVTTFHISGQLDAGNVAELEEKAISAVNAGTRNLLLDLGNVSFMSSAAFRTIHKVYQALSKEKGGCLKLLNPSEEISRITKTLGFDSFIDVLSGDLKQAVDSF
ncbi:MAG: STAS domain-containing protein [Rhodospirillales bacterium]|nr:STAS domain-containing protein [Rhodospirillales bacterium]